MRLTLSLFTSAWLCVATVHAKEFQPISAEQVADTYPYKIHQPVLTISSVSGDGSIIGGAITETGVIYDCASFDCGSTGFVWSVADRDRTPLGDFVAGPGLANRMYPTGVTALSFNGDKALTTNVWQHYESTINHGGQAVALRDPVVQGEWLVASDFSSSGDVVVGSLDDEPFLWTEESGIVPFVGIDPASRYGPAAISGDGTVTVMNDSPVSPYGLLSLDGQRKNAIRWSAETGPSELAPAGTLSFSRVTKASGDGSVIVGASYAVDLPWTATVWRGDAPALLATLNGWSSEALDVSADGGSIVGTTSYASPATDAFFYPEAILWRNGKAFSLQELLVEQHGLGPALDGWRLTSATAISDDGTVIAGQGIDPEGLPAAWVVNLAIPEPTGATMACFVLAAAFGWRRSGG